MKTIYNEVEVPTVPDLNMKICSAHYMFNTVMNNGDQVLFFDMRSMYYHLRGHLDYNFKQDSNIPLPVDYMLENKLSMKDVYTWLPKILERDPQLKHFNIINDQKLKAFSQIRRKYVFIIAAHQKNIDSFKIEKLFRPTYGEGVIALNKKDRL
jgi:hypothetical protein